MAKERICVTLWVWMGVKVVSEGRRRRIIVGKSMPRMRGPSRGMTEQSNQMEQRMDILWSSATDVNIAASAFHTSPIAAKCCGEIELSSTRGAIFAVYSINAGRRAFGL